MSTFELEASCFDNRNCGEECIIAQKIFDQCRLQKCLTPCILGPARAAFTGNACSEYYHEGEIIVPPCNAASVSIKDLKLCQINILSKKQSPFRPGFWDVEVKFVFTYDLVFKSGDNCEICSLRATSSYKTKVTLFGGDDGDVVVSTDMNCCGDALTSGPFITVEGKAISLAAELNYPNSCDCRPSCCDPCCDPCRPSCCDSCSDPCRPSCCDPCSGTGQSSCLTDARQLPGVAPVSVDVTIGLFAIIKLFRPVNIVVDSHGFCIPEECRGIPANGNPCDFFDNLEFPMGLFVPGMKKDRPIPPRGDCDCGPAPAPRSGRQDSCSKPSHGRGDDRCCR